MDIIESMETNNKENWEDIFFRVYGENILKTYAGFYKWRDNLDETSNIPFEAGMDFVERIKHFISSTLSSSKAKWKEELVGKIEQIKKSPKFSSGVAISEEYNQALQDCIEIIKEL